MKLLVALLPLLAGLATYAQPAYLNYQGRLTDSAGQPLTGEHTLEFNIYSNAVIGNAVWGPFQCDGDTGPGHTAKAFLTSDGRFNVILGDADANNVSISQVFTGATRFVEIKVDGGAAIQPRQQFLSAPYALETANAQTLNHVAPVQYLNPPGIVVPFAGAADKVPDGWLLCDGRALLRTDYPGLYAAIGTAWGEDGAHVGQYFRVPDLRGMFLRGVTDARADSYADPDKATRTAAVYGGNAGNNVGSIQDNKLSVHNHIWGDTTSGDVFASKLQSWTTPTATIVSDILYPFVSGHAGDTHDDDTFGVNIANTTLYTKPTSTEVRSGETRPNNAYVNYIIKY